MHLSIIIVNWNTRDLLRDSLQSIFDHAPVGDFEIIVIDNASTDDTVSMVHSEFPTVNLITNSDNVGFATANNIGISASSGHYLLLLNPDTIVHSGAFDALISFADSQPTAGAVGALLLNDDGSLQTSCYRTPTLLREFWRMFHLDILYPFTEYRMDKWSRETPREVDVLKGACILLRRAVIEQVGLLDESFFMYSEEVDLCRRIQQAGWTLHWAPQAIVTHLEGQSSRQVATPMFMRLYQGKIMYFRKHYGLLITWFYKIILLFAGLTRLLLSPLALAVPRPRRDRMLALSGRYGRLILALPKL